jgi:hypothetical protein
MRLTRRRFVHIAVLTPIGLAFARLNVTPTVLAMSPGWPATEDELRSQFNVVNLDGCLTITREGAVGFEIHGNKFRVSPGSSTVGVMMHLNPGHYTFLSGSPQPQGKNSGGGDRFSVSPGQEVTVETTGGCDFGMSLYPIYPDQASAPAPATCQAFPSSASEFQNGWIQVLEGGFNPEGEMGTGFEGHGDHFMVNVPALSIPIVLDLNGDAGKYQIRGGNLERYGFTPGSNHHGHRYVLKSCQTAQIEVWGKPGSTPQGYGFTVWPGDPKHPRED